MKLSLSFATLLPFVLALGEAERYRPLNNEDGFYKWLRGPMAKDIIKTVCRSAWEALVKAYEDFVAKTDKLLKRVGTLTFALVVDSRPHSFKPRKDLWIQNNDPNFLRFVAAYKVKPDQAGVSFSVHYDVLSMKAEDTEVETALPQHHLFDEAEACGMIAEIITSQPMDNGHANFFYLESCVVCVVCKEDCGEWKLSEMFRGDHTWNVGDKVFYPAEKKVAA